MYAQHVRCRFEPPHKNVRVPFQLRVALLPTARTWPTPARERSGDLPWPSFDIAPYSLRDETGMLCESASNGNRSTRHTGQPIVQSGG